MIPSNLVPVSKKVFFDAFNNDKNQIIMPIISGHWDAEKLSYPVKWEYSYDNSLFGYSEGIKGKAGEKQYYLVKKNLQ